VRDAFFEGQDIHAISVAEKGVLWFQMHAEGRAGHGSTPYPGEAPERLLRAMELIDRKYKPKVAIDPSLDELLANVGHEKGGIVGAVLRSRLLVRLLVKGKLKAVPATRAAITNTVHLTGMLGAESPNVVPTRVSAQYDSRLLPGVLPEEILEELEHITRKVDGISFEVLSAYEAAGSSWDDPLYEAIAAYAVEGEARAAAGPVLSVGFTDSIYARPMGTRAYGYVPFLVTEDEAGTMHGHAERVSVANVHRGVRVLFSIVVDAAADAP
jgi:carboxypeptidase PM20D1